MKRLGFQAIFSVSLIPLQTAALAENDVSCISVTAFAPVPTTHSERVAPVHHFFGGRTIDVPLVIGGHSEKPVDLRARLVQLVGPLGVSFHAGLEVFSGRAVNDDEPLAVSVSLLLPEVRDESDFELQFQVRTRGEKWRDAGRARIRLYSQGILEALKPLSRNVLVRLKDDDDKLRPLLASLDVDVTDYRAPVLRSGTPVVTLMVNGDDALDLADLEVLERESVVVFNERVRTLPKVVMLPYLDGHLIQVDLEVLNNLESDPMVQKTFMEIIKLAHPGP